MLTFNSLNQLQPIISSLFSGHSKNWIELNGISSDEFLENMEEHGMVPLLHYQDYLTGCCHDWPASMQDKISAIAKQETVLALARINDLKKVLQLLNEENIHPLLMKGVPLSYLIYPEPGLRPHSDTDLLIKKEDKGRVSALIKQAGYQPVFEVSADYLSSQFTCYKYDNANVYHAYDIHWQISNITSTFSHAMNYDSLFDHAQTIPELGTNARTLNNIDALLLACFHRHAHLMHGGDCLIWLYDIHLLLEAMQEHDLQLTYNKAMQLDIEQIFSDALVTTQEWFNTRIPENIITKIKASTNSEQTAEKIKSGRLTGTKSQARMAFKHLPSWHDRLVYIYQKVFPPVDYMVWRYEIKNRLLLPFYYLYRCLYGIYAMFR